jgi:SAM-dependent methyltransferase
MTSFLTNMKKWSAYTCPEGTDKIVYHSYASVYNDIIGDLSKKDNVSILEIGICSGSFLKAVKETLPDANVVGIDIDLSHYKFQDDDITIYNLDATKERIEGSFDLIVDDASHRVEDQMATFRLYAQLLNKGGVYIIEDISNPVYQSIFRDLADYEGLSMEWIDLRHIRNIYDDVMVLYKKSIF